MLYCVNHRFPKNRLISIQWNVALGIDEDKFAQGLVCQDHFEDKHFKRKNKTELKPDAVPTIFSSQEITLYHSTDHLDSLASINFDQVVPDAFDIANDAEAIAIEDTGCKKIIKKSTVCFIL